MKSSDEPKRAAAARVERHRTAQDHRAAGSLPSPEATGMPAATSSLADAPAGARTKCSTGTRTARVGAQWALQAAKALIAAAREISHTGATRSPRDACAAGEVDADQTRGGRVTWHLLSAPHIPAETAMDRTLIGRWH
jgi:hypothetical protein